MTWWPLWFKLSATSKFHATEFRSNWALCGRWAGDEKSAYPESGHPPEKQRCRLCYRELERRFRLDDDWAHMHPEWRPDVTDQPIQSRMHFEGKSEPEEE